MSLQNKIIKHRNFAFSNSKSKIEHTNTDYDGLYASIVNGLVGSNKFVTEFCFVTNSFIRKSGISACLGYEDSNFTVSTLNNDPNAKTCLTHKDDILHKARYDMITYSLLSSNYDFKPLEDYYKLSFRMLHKDGSVLQVQRSVYLFRLNAENIPLSQLSIWEVSQNSLLFVKAEYFTKNYPELIKEFCKLNSDILGLHFTPTERKIINLKGDQKSNVEIQQMLDKKSVRTIEKHMENIKSKCRKFALANNHKKCIRRSADVLSLLKSYGLFPFYC